MRNKKITKNNRKLNEQLYSIFGRFKEIKQSIEPNRWKFDSNPYIISVFGRIRRDDC